MIYADNKMNIIHQDTEHDIFLRKTLLRTSSEVLSTLKVLLTLIYMLTMSPDTIMLNYFSLLLRKIQKTARGRSIHILIVQRQRCIRKLYFQKFSKCVYQTLSYICVACNSI